MLKEPEGFCPECGDFIGETIECGECIDYREKQKKGCKCLGAKEECPSCSNQSPRQDSKESRDKPEDATLWKQEVMRDLPSSGIQSPQDIVLEGLQQEYGKGTFNLSDKIFIQPKRAGREVVMVRDVREFIRRLKEEFCLFYQIDFIDKLAGSKLVKGDST